MENHLLPTYLPYHHPVPTRYTDGLPGPGLAYSSFPVPIPSSDPHVLWNPVTVFHGYNMYQCYQPMYTHPLLPVLSYDHTHQRLSPRQSVPLPSSYQQNIDDVLVLDSDLTFTMDEPIYTPPMQPHQQPYSHPIQRVLPQQSTRLPSLYQQNIDDILVLDLTYTADDHDREYKAYRMKREAELEGHVDIKRYSSSKNQSTEASSDQDTCVVCQSEYEDNEKIGTIKKCGHQYHLNCVKKWLKRKNLCPICKATAFTKGGMAIKPRERRFGDYNEWL